MKRILLPLVISSVALMVLPQHGVALDPPHNFTNTIDCSSCHTSHHAADGAITKVAGNSNLCQSCHTVGGPASFLPFAEADQAYPLPGLPSGVSASGTSHRWDSGTSGHVKVVSPNTSPGKVQSAGTFTGRYAKTYTITITTQGDAGTARFNWTAVRWPGDTGGGSGNNVLSGTNTPLDDGVTVTFTTGSSSPSFILNDAWRIYVRTEINQPTLSALLPRISDGKIMCSTCHDQHSQALNPFDPAAPAYGGSGTGAGRHFQRANNDTNQICLDCHSVRNVGSLASQVGNLSHPVNVAIPGTGDYKLPTTVPLDKTTGKVQCMSCHKPHFNPANDGALTRLSNVTSLCADCHTLADTSTPAAHLNASTGVLWPGGFYGSTFPEVTDTTKRGFCPNCHQPHGWPDKTTPNEAQDYPKLLVELSDFSDTKTDSSKGEALCYSCHRSGGPASHNAVAAFNPAPTTSTYLDQFTSISYSGSNGTTSWTANPWTEIGETDGTGAGVGRVVANTTINSAGSCAGATGNCLRLGSLTAWSGRGVRRVANLSSAAGGTATLTFSYRRTRPTCPGAASTANVTMAISTNGTTWTTLGTYIMNGCDTGHATQSFDVSSYISSTTYIRFLTAGTVGSTTDYYFADNVQIAYAPPSGGNDFGNVTYGHPINDSQQVSGPYRSVECRDCHDVHMAQANAHTYSTTATSTRNQVSNPIKGVLGWAVNYDSPSVLGNFVAPDAPRYSYANPATYEYQICFKCHSGNSWNFGTAPNGMSPNGPAVTRAAETDLAQEFSPKNKSGHPVVTGLNNYSNSGAPKALPTTAMVAPWNTNVGTQTMMCSDCHNTDAASPAAQGPHGSAAKFMLRGPNVYWPTDASGNLYTLGNNPTSNSLLSGLFCMNCHTLRNNSATNDTTAWSGNNVHWEHSGPQISNRPCVNCHIVIPHGGKVSRLIATRTAGLPARYAYNNDATTNVWVTAFIKTTRGSYNTSNCSNAGCSGHSTISGETW